MDIETPHNFLLFTTITQHQTDIDVFKEMKELKSLVEAYGGSVVETVTQRRGAHEKGMYIGRGKLGEMADTIRDLEVDVVVLNSQIVQGQIFEMTNILSRENPDIQVWDRVNLILKIFASHAHTAEAKLQIELAAMRHMGPRIYGMGHEMSQQGGGIGTRGIGETNTELMKRHWRDQIKTVQDKLDKLSKDRERQLEQRVKVGFQTASIIGYTNAGKTSLFNFLTGKENIVNNALFVTLDSSVGKVKLPSSKREILVSDTIGFIQNLPTSLIDAFRSTLMESVHADILIHVIDISDEDWRRKIATVDEVLSELELTSKKRIFVFNKIDVAEEIDRAGLQDEFEEFSPQFISVAKKKGISEMLDTIEQLLPIKTERKKEDSYFG